MKNLSDCNKGIIIHKSKHRKIKTHQDRFEGENYVILLPAEETDDEESDEVVILKEEKDAEGVGEDEESYVSVDDEEVLNKVFDIFKDKFKDEFNFVEE